jgi:hypothetical protein
MKVILAGNGVNRVDQNESWESLLNSLIDLTGNNIQLNEKPFPLLYEEILMTLQKSKTKTEDDLLDIIIEKIRKIQINEIHQKITEIFDVILTTNYDYTFEKALSVDELYKTSTREVLYSLYRCIEIGNIKIWHIHGEANKPKSICLGYERYGANIQKTRNLIISGDEKKKIDPMKKRLLNNSNLKISWVDYFFSENIYIVGLGLDFQEIDLWWLLDFRAREINKGTKKINNKIVYYCSTNEKISRIQVLKSMHVDVIQIEITQENYKSFYFEVINRIERDFT